MPLNAVQRRLEALSTAVAGGYLIDTKLNVISKQGWKWKVLRVILLVLRPIYACLGQDIYREYRVNHVALALLKLCEKHPDLSLDLKTKVVAHILVPLEAKTKGKYSAAIEQAKTGILAVGENPGVLAQRKTVVQGALNRFAHQLHQRLATRSPGSICFAPISLAPILGMILMGLPQEQKGAFLQTLGLQDFPEPIVHLALNELVRDVMSLNGTLCSIQTAHALAAPDSAQIFPQYRSRLSDFYRAEAFSVAQDPNEASRAINAWVAEKTGGHVQDLVQPADLTAMDPRQTFFALLNGVYFAGKWEKDFQDAVDDEFIFAEAGAQQVKMMSVTKHLSAYDGDTFRMLEIPYKSPEGHRLTHLVFLPNAGNSLQPLEDQLTPGFVSRCRRYAEVHEYDVKMPKINVTLKIDELLDDLDHLNLPVKSELSQLGERATLTKIIHQAKVQVDEKGTVAVAATAAIGTIASCVRPDLTPVRRREFHINRDYAYFLMDNDQILFQGNVKDPQALVR